MASTKDLVPDSGDCCLVFLIPLGSIILGVSPNMPAYRGRRLHQSPIVSLSSPQRQHLLNVMFFLFDLRLHLTCDAGLTAVTFITEAYNVHKGDIILVHTVAGGLGLLFAQLIKARGATVIGTTSTPEKAALAKSYGADHVILYPVEDTVQRVLEITNGEGVHAVFDGVGKDT